MSLAKEAAIKYGQGLPVERRLMAFGKPSARTEKSKRKQKESYLRNREQRRRETKKWRLSHKAEISRKKKIYLRRVSLGSVVPRRRARAGLGYQVIGVHAPPGVSHGVTMPTTSTVREERF